MVLLFYIISGYVLSLKPLKLIRSGSWDQVFHTLSSSVFRRGFRLFMPALISTFITMLLLQARLFEYISEKSTENVGYRLEKFELHAPRLETLGGQFRHWLASSWAMINPWTWERYLNPYNPNLWSLSAEFRGSLILFLAVLGLGRLKARFRLPILSCLIWTSAVCQKWEVAASFAGMVLAERDLHYGTLEVAKNKPTITKQTQTKEILLFIGGLYLASYPKFDGNETPGYRTLSNIVPFRIEQDKWWQIIGGMIIVYSATNSRLVEEFFTGSFLQYLGEVSFPVYVVHGPILHSVGLLVMSTSWKYMGRDTLSQKVLNFAVSAIIVIPVLSWVAYVFRKVVDIPCAKFSRWLEINVTSDTAYKYSTVRR